MLKDKYEIDEKTREKVLKSYFNENSGRLQNLPNKEKKKVIVFQKIAENFEADRKYTEKEVNEIIKRFYDDYFIIRRSLVDFGYMKRTQDCREYWVNE